MSNKSSDMSIDVDLNQFPLEPGEVLTVYADTVLTSEMRQRITEFLQQHYPNNKIEIRCKPATITFSAEALAEYLRNGADENPPAKEWSVKIDGPYHSPVL